jgi:bile acid-coenzyme A ligase
VFQLLEAAAEKGAQLPSLTGISSGATLVPPELVRRIDEQTQSRAAPGNGYGLTETSGAAIANFGAAYVARPDSVGLPMSPVIEVRIAGDDGQPLPPGEIGEIWLRLRSGEDAPFRYVGADTPAPVDGGWRSFGDMGHLDAEGFLYIADRRQDMIVTGGVNVFPAEVEGALSDHPEVADVAVVGVPDPEWQRAVHAVVQPRDPAAPPSAGDLRAWCKERLSGPKVPKSFEFVDELPRTSAGKINRSRLAAERAGGVPAAGEGAAQPAPA